jgi:hypothetical protein
MPEFVIARLDPRANPELPCPFGREPIHRLVLRPLPAHPRPVHVHLLWFSQQMVELVSGESTSLSVVAFSAGMFESQAHRCQSVVAPTTRAGILLKASSAAIL